MIKSNPTLSRNLQNRSNIDSVSSNAKFLSYPIIVHSHLRWNWVWQRPQQFLTRLSKRHPILFVEEPLKNTSLKTSRVKFQIADGFPNIKILCTELSQDHFVDQSKMEHEHTRLINTILNGPDGRIFNNSVLWFYDPMAVNSALAVSNRAIVYDCMDELSNFHNAPAELSQREQKLLTIADIVFAGGPKIHKSKSRFNSNCHCYGCGVDVHHFGQANSPKIPTPDDLLSIPKPILGYFGVIDERIDYNLISALAFAHPEWSIVLIGPTAKIDPTILPQTPNLYWMGPRHYKQLPAYAKGFNACLMPFQRNKATEFINPTKALEYMACGRPIISTYIEDVALQFGHVIEIASSETEFIKACERAIAHPSSIITAQGLSLAAQNSWDSIVNKLEQHIADVLLR